MTPNKLRTSCQARPRRAGSKESLNAGMDGTRRRALYRRTIHQAAAGAAASAMNRMTVPWGAPTYS